MFTVTITPTTFTVARGDVSRTVSGFDVIAVTENYAIAVDLDRHYTTGSVDHFLSQLLEG